MNENDTPPSPSNEGLPEATDAPAVQAGPTFEELGLGAPVVRALTEMGFAHAMMVQATTIPLVKAGKDLMVQSRTGSGKTAAFGIPLIDGVVRADDKFAQAIILLPTRELALQVASELTRISAHSGITVVPVYGGAPMGRQIEQLKAGGQIVCGTPGRVLDHLRRGTLVLDRVRCAVLDECDEMLSMGFQEDIERILERTPTERQTLLFSATVPEGIQRLSRRFLRDPENVKLSTGSVSVQEIRHVYYTIPGGQRENELLRILAFENPGRAIVFCNTREETGRVAEFLRRQGFDSEAISSDLAQNDRERVMTRMREGGIRFLVATDVAARGIDLESLSHVINYTFPESPEVYIHRTGRTGRAGRHGTAISLIGPAEVGAFYYVKLLYKIKPEERSLPSEAEIRSKREGERIETLRGRYPSDPGPAFRSLARRLMAAVDGERLCAAMLAEVLAIADKEAAASAPPVEAPVRRESIIQPGPRPGSRSDRPRDRDRGADRGGDRNERPRYGRDGGGRDGGGREGTRDGGARESSARPPRGDRPPFRSERGEPNEANRAKERPETPPAPVSPPPPAAATPEPTKDGAEITAERPAYSGRDRERPRRTRDRSERGGREARIDSVPGTLAPPADRTLGRPVAPTKTDAPGGEAPSRSGHETEFWSVWSDDKTGATPAAEAPPPPRPRTNEEWRRPPARPAAPAGESDATATEARLFLNLGRKDEASSDDVLALFAELGVAVAAGDIDVMNTHSYVNVPASEADRICETLSGRDHNGRPLLCERARPRRR